MHLAHKLCLVLLCLGRDGGDITLDVGGLARVHEDVVGDLVAESSGGEVMAGERVSDGREKWRQEQDEERRDEGKPVHRADGRMWRWRGGASASEPRLSRREFNARRDVRAPAGCRT